MPKGKGKPAGGYRAGEKGSYGCDGYPTVSADGTVHGCHPTKAKAAQQARAIWAATTKKSMNINIDYFAKSSCKEGDFVLATCEDEIHVGIVQFVMTDGTLGLEGSEYALTATPEDSVMLIRTLEFDEEDGWEETPYMIGSMHSMLTKIAPLKLEALEEVPSESDIAMSAYDSQIGKNDNGYYADPFNSLSKRERSQETRQRMAEHGTAMPDGSFPIANASDLRNAIQSVGRAKDYNAAKQHIMHRARSLGLVAELPDSWKNTASKGMTVWGGTVFDISPLVK
jgi:hypothetical protein